MAGTTPVDLDGFYDGLRERGIDYGPAFQGLVELSRSGDTAYAVVRLPESAAGAGAESAAAGGFALHPALLDAALHAVAVLDADTGRVSLPFEWTGVELYATGATELRVRIERDPASSEARLWMTDAHGDPVAYVDALVLRPATEQQLRQRTSDHLYRLDFRPSPATREVPAETWVLGGSGDLAHATGGRPVTDVAGLRALLDAGDEPPARLVVDSTTRDPGDLADAVRTATATALHVLQGLLAESRLEGTELVWVTRQAVPAGPGRASTVWCTPRSGAWSVPRAPSTPSARCGWWTPVPRPRTPPCSPGPCPSPTSPRSPYGPEGYGSRGWSRSTRSRKAPPGELRYRRERHWSPAEPVSWAGSSPGTWCGPAASGASY